MEHGWSARNDPLKSDLATDKPLMLVFSKRRKKTWQRATSKQIEIMGAPFVLYKNMNKIGKRKDAKGTVVFPSHSTYFTRSKFSIEEYCEVLNELPAEFKPITICLFWLDYIDPSTDIYRKYGFDVVSAGVKIANSLSFVRNFYRILTRHKYATSNDVGSYAFYAIDLGIPFFLTGTTPTVVNQGQKDKNISEVDRMTDHEFGRKTTGLFSTGPTTQITTRQESFVKEELGINEALKREDMNKLFWKHFKEQKYYLVAVIPYIFSSIFVALLFNGPWIGLLTRIRKKMTS
jgi:hypothetical protein